MSGTVVVGTDGSSGAAAALRWANAHARRTDAELVVVMAWSYLDQRHLPDDPEFHPGYDQAEADRVLAAFADEALAGEEPAPRVVRRAVNDLAARALLSAADGADLLVVGRRGLGGFRGMLLGSVSQQVVSHASCPVLVHQSAEV